MRGLWAFAMRRLPAAPASCSSYIFINFRLRKPRKQPHFEKILRGWRMARGAFGRELVKLKVPDTDVRTDGALV